jgi:hypothetical protein
MPRIRLLTDAQRKENKKISNNKPENVEKRRLNSRRYYQRKKEENLFIVSQPVDIPNPSNISTINTEDIELVSPEN